MDIIREIKQFVENECKKPTSHYGYEPFPFHFVPMVKYALKLANQLGGDKEIIEIATWLHDIGSIMYGWENHHVTGTEIAEEKLNSFGYNSRKTELVKKCILNHRGSQERNRDSLEEKIVAEADVMSSFDNIAGIFKAAFIYENLTQGEAKISVREKLKRKWNQLHFLESKVLLKPKYEAAMLLLD
jgi:uncharacterized protein